MKGIKLFFSVCLGCLAFNLAAPATEPDDTARAAVRRDTNTTTSVRQTTGTRGTPTTKQNSSQKNTAPRTDTTQTGRNRATTVAKRTTNTTTNSRTVTSRTTAPTSTKKNVSTRTNERVSVRAPDSSSSHNQKTTRSRTASTTRIATKRTAGARATRTPARAATVERGALSTNYTHCRDVFYECMDEFCATKDANLRRCACSSRAHDFDNMQSQFSKFEDKMSDFNQRLLMVNMDAEDVAAINTATEGEDAFYDTDDTTKSKKTLDAIAKKLNKTFGETSNGGTGLGAITLSLNMDSAFDSVDSMMGASTTTKTGTALYSAAYPVCRDIAAEVCTEDELSLAQSGYNMLMEQDCNTVYKSYQAQADAARNKVLESSALLDMSRLDIHQRRNSDDILTCRKKMLEMLSDSTVCGTNLEKCLDMTGRYIDPTTGTAFLTENLSDLENLIIRPAENQTWISANTGTAFVTYLKDKKDYLAPATEKCQDIADSLWDGFIEDALAQIKLAQGAKLEEIRHACTTLTAECINNANESIENFDIRALSVFGVKADRTANTMCADIKNACSALMTNTTNSDDWDIGISDIATEKTFDTILSSCTQVGRNCVIQICRGMSSNFDLCNDVYNSNNRHSVLERTACWDDVLSCVASAGQTSIMNIMKLHNKINDSGGPTNSHAPYNFYEDIYPTGETVPDNINPQNPNLYDICSSECTNISTDSEKLACAECRLAERIWGNCEGAPTISTNQNQIIYNKNNKTDTIMSWFGQNTGTLELSNSCANLRCAPENISYNNNADPTCADKYITIGDGGHSKFYCPTDTGHIMSVPGDGQNYGQNCCFNQTNVYGHQPITTTNDDIAACYYDAAYNDEDIHQWEPVPVQNTNIRIPKGTTGTPEYKPTIKNSSNYILCLGDNETDFRPSASADFPGGDKTCKGRFILVTSNNKYYAPSNTTSGTCGEPCNGGEKYNVEMFYYKQDSDGITEQLYDTNDTKQVYIRYYTEE